MGFNKKEYMKKWREEHKNEIKEYNKNYSKEYHLSKMGRARMFTVIKVIRVTNGLINHCNPFFYATFFISFNVVLL